MAYRQNQFQYDVGEAVSIVSALVLAKRGPSGGTDAAIRTVAQDCKVSKADIRRLFQPSRRPKDVRHGLWLRITSAYRRYIEAELQRLERAKFLLDALDHGDPAARAELAIEAENLARRIRQHLT